MMSDRLVGRLENKKSGVVPPVGRMLGYILLRQMIIISFQGKVLFGYVHDLIYFG
jgi:hypothetical protein